MAINLTENVTGKCPVCGKDCGSTKRTDGTVTTWSCSSCARLGVPRVWGTGKWSKDQK